MSAERQPLDPVEGLASITKLPPPPPRRRPGAVHTPHTESSTAKTAQRESATSRKPKKASQSQVNTGYRSFSLSMPTALITRLQQRSRVDDVTHADVLMDAFISESDQISDLLAHAEDKKKSTDGLFVRQSVRRSAEPMGNLSLRLLATNLDAIDQLVTDHGAPSRSALCVAVLAAYLGSDTAGN